MPKEYNNLKDLNYKGRDVIVLCNFDVPLKDMSIVDDSKIRSHIETLQYLDKVGAKKILIVSYLGRPKGKIVPELSLRIVVNRLSELLGKPVGFCENIEDALPHTKFVLLENIRFHKEQKSKNMEERDRLAKKIIEKLVNPLYINDGFANNHRNTASVTSIPKFITSASGFLLEKEIHSLSPYVHPEGKSVAIIGGAKVGDKIEIIKGFLKKYDYVIIGGGMVFTFIKALGYEIGVSLLNKEELPIIKKLYENEDFKEKIVLPDKVVATRIINTDKKIKDLTNQDYTKPFIGDIHTIPKDANCLDVLFGPQALDRIQEASFVYWNGPMGVFENPDFREGSQQIGQALERHKGRHLVGGGDTLECIKVLDLTMQESTGGGASSLYIIKGTLPGIEALKKSYVKFSSGQR